MNVLFISEDAELRGAAQTIFEDRGVDLIGEDNIAVAKEVLDEQGSDFVVINEHVNGGSPFDFFNYILEYHPSIPAIIFADTIDAGDIERRPENVLRYDRSHLSLALEELVDLVETTAQFQAKTLYPEPEDEEARLAVLEQFDFDALEGTEFYDRLTRKGAELFNVPMCYVGVIESDKERFLTCHGADFEEIAREETICSYAIITDDVMVVDDVQNDPRFREMDSIHNIDLAWYASASIKIDGQRIGTFCIADTKPREFTEKEKKQLQALADEFAAELAQHKHSGH